MIAAFMALGLAINIMNECDEEGVDINILLECLIDAAKLMAESQFRQTQSRRACIIVTKVQKKKKKKRA